MDLFRVRLNCIDHYQATPSKFDPPLRSDIKPSQLQNEPKLPVIRVFGATETGQKVCAHIHGAFPYLYIEYTGRLVPDQVGAYLHRLHLSIDHALTVSYRRNVYDGKSKFVARITLVKGIPFYGFHVGYRFYLKIYLLNPMFMTRLADLLQQGMIMKRVFQPYEAHLQYLLQWMVDYNLYGCGYIDCSKVTFRSPLPDCEEIANPAHILHDRSIPKEFVTPESELGRVSHCSIEVDICCQDILNRQDIKPRPLHHDFIERLSPLAPEEKLVHSMAGLWKDETRRRKAMMSSPAPGSSPFPAEVLVSMSADPRNSQPGGWIHEEEYREMIANLIKEERDKSDEAALSFNTFVEPIPFSSSIKTSLESVEDLYPENLRPILGLSQRGSTANINYDVDDHGDREVDETRISTFNGNTDDDNDFPYDSDEDVMRELELSQRKKGDRMEENHLDAADMQKPEHEVDDESKPGDENFAEQPLRSENPDDLYDASRVTTFRSGQGAESSVVDASGMSGGSLNLKNLKRSLSPDRNSTRSLKRGKNSSEATEVPSTKMNSETSHLTAEVTGPSAVELLRTMTAGRPNNGAIGQKARTVNGFASERGFSTNIKSSQEGHQANQTTVVFPHSCPVVEDPQEVLNMVRIGQKENSQVTSTRKGKNLAFDTLLPSAQPTLSHHRSLGSTPSTIISGQTQVSDAAPKYRASFRGHQKGKFLCFNELPPAKELVLSTMQDFQLPSIIYQDAFYSNEQDAPERTRAWAGREFKLESLTVPFLPDFDPNASSDANFGIKSGVMPDKVKEEKEYRFRRQRCSLRSWAIAEPPPTFAEVEKWALDEKATKVLKGEGMDNASKPNNGSRPQNEKLSQLDGPTQKNRHGFKYTQNQKTNNVTHEAQYMSTMSLELHINTRGNFVPNPEEDEVQCVFWCFQADDSEVEDNCNTPGCHLGIVLMTENGETAQNITRQAGVEVVAEDSELDVLVRMVEIVRNLDPDILTGYEVHGGSWGYLIERARLKYDYDLCDEFSRMRSQSHGQFGKDNDKWGFNNTSTIRVTGRHMINIWRAMRGELNLLQYTMENVAFHLMHRRIPHFTWADLTTWYTKGKPRDLARLINHYTSRVQLDLALLEQNELIARTSEQARLLGVDFFSVFSRGSQFKVESLMFRIAKPENFMLVSPSRKQVGSQNALECLPLVLEPQSAFYNSPVLVLDFQSLYPSVMIAYNYCYSTFLGRIVNWRGMNKMGFTEYKRKQRLLELLKDHVNISPNGMMYVKPEIRKSLLAKMLVEILETRVMVKSGMKVDKDDKALQRLLNNRQLALKLIANVTYGYTSASFSGRMPCSEIADSIVQTARETLERAIALIHSVKRWGAEVVYGDTDSLFVHLKGRTKDQAFDIGEEIAKTVTDMNPRPVKLKFEKVYLPCVLLAKKRYVGFKYENRNQVNPDFDAKGIETVRRDGTPAEQKIEEKALKILFRTADLSEVKAYFQKQCEKIMKGSVSIQDFCFAKEVKLGTYSDKGPPPPGALISTKRMLNDARAEPQYGERVPYVVITGAPGARLFERCVEPRELLENNHYELDAEYYISKNLIPPLERIFNVVGANVRNWYDEMPKYQRVRRIDVNLQLQGRSSALASSQRTLESYMKSSSCLVCKEKLEGQTGGGIKSSICQKCLSDKPRSILALQSRLGNEERKYADILRVCRSCEGIGPVEEVRCDSLDCPVFYTRVRERARLRNERGVVGPVVDELVRAIERVELKDLEW